jgi:hypothetical protein
MPKVNEKTLELNVGAEILRWLRLTLSPKAYLRGLTQEEEKDQGVDSFAQFNQNTKIYAFQFKAPKLRNRIHDGEPYYFSINREQHDNLYKLASMAKDSVFYVFPYYLFYDKLYGYCPSLLNDTWFLPVQNMKTSEIFSTQNTKIIRCIDEIAHINPEYRLFRVSQESMDGAFAFEVLGEGIRAGIFRDWYKAYYNSISEQNKNKKKRNLGRLRLLVINE